MLLGLLESLSHLRLVEEAEHLRVPLLDLGVLERNHLFVLEAEVPIVGRQRDRLFEGFGRLIKLVLALVCLSQAQVRLKVGLVGLNGAFSSLDCFFQLVFLQQAERLVRVQCRERFIAIVANLFRELLDLRLWN